MIWPVFTNRSAGAKLRIGNLLGEWPVRQRGHSLYAEEKRVFRIIDKVGVDHIVFETDLLHPTSLFDEDRLVGALANLGYTMSDQMVGNILRRHGIPPALDRKQTTTWKECIRLPTAPSPVKVPKHVEFIGKTEKSMLRDVPRKALSVIS